MTEEKKPDIINVLAILYIKNRIAMLYEILDQKTQALHKEFGPGTFEYDLDAELPAGETLLAKLGCELLEKGQFMRFELINNIKRLETGQSIFKTTAMKAFTFTSKSLKRRPRSLKD